VKARELGLAIGEGTPGELNAITDVAGVRVGHTTLVEGDAVRTGVTVIFPHDGDPGTEPVFAGCHRLNGNGELTGLEWVRDSGLLTTPIGLTNTHSVGVVRDALIAWAIREGLMAEDSWSLPVVGETWDGTLNDINGLHVTAEHVFAALESASDGPVAEGNVGSGTGMICHGFKGGIGTASRVVSAEAGGYTVGVLVQANHGARERLSIDGVPVGREIPRERVPLAGVWASRNGPEGPSRDRSAGEACASPKGPGGRGSVIIVVATDAPLLPHQLDRLAQRAGLGVGRLGGAGENGSGDIFIAFSTANRGLAGGGAKPVTMLGNDSLDPLFYATIESTEEAIVNSMLQAETMTGKDGATAYRLDPELLRDVMSSHGRC
jgi:D-aminopeptidase